MELADSAGARRADAARRYLPFGGYRQSAPTPRIERGFTGSEAAVHY